MTDVWELTTTAPAKTYRLGVCLGRLLQPGDVLLLAGDLGAGKTHFAKGVAAGLAVAEPVTSPTFTLVAEYDGRLPFAHMDLYRLYDEPQAVNPILSDTTLAQIAFADYLDGTQVVLIEWPEGVRHELDEYLWIQLRVAAMGDAREIKVQAVGDTAKTRLREWVSAWASS